MNNGTYRVINRISRLYLPLVGVLYYLFSIVFDIAARHVEQVLGSLMIVKLILGIVLEISAKKQLQPDGQIVITTNGLGKKTFTLELDKTPEDIEKMKLLTFKITDVHSTGYEEPD